MIEYTNEFMINWLRLENDDIKEFAETVIECIPEYWKHVAASSSGKYHPRNSLGEGGLFRHIMALIQFLNWTFEIKCMAENWTSRERDLMRVAGMMHDAFKSGTTAEYEGNHHTKFDHPLIAANAVRKYKQLNLIPEEEVEIIANAIESHMGQWNTSFSSKTVLPEPHNKYQKILHWADYFASRKGIEMEFSNIERKG